MRVASAGSLGMPAWGAAMRVWDRREGQAVREGGARVAVHVGGGDAVADDVGSQCPSSVGVVDHPPGAVASADTTPATEVDDTYLSAWEAGYKGITVYVDGFRRGPRIRPTSTAPLSSSRVRHSPVLMNSLSRPSAATQTGPGGTSRNCARWFADRSSSSQDALGGYRKR
jgi:hypothetical protein